MTPETREFLTSPAGLEAAMRLGLAGRLPSFEMSVCVIYGERDRILPDIAETMERVAADLPEAEVTALSGCGHFLQEESPREIGALLADFFARATR
jgi:pimeloyl-ACP methyl ester carboxylesterase